MSLIPLYGCEIWAIRVAKERMLTVFDNKTIRRILHARRRDCVPKVELWCRLCLSSISAQLIQRRLRWLGHAARRPNNELIRDLVLPTPPRTWCRRTGGQPKTWTTTIKDSLWTTIETGALVSSHRTFEPRVLPCKTWSIELVKLAQPAPGEYRHKYK